MTSEETPFGSRGRRKAPVESPAFSDPPVPELADPVQVIAAVPDDTPDGTPNDVLKVDDDAEPAPGLTTYVEPRHLNVYYRNARIGNVESIEGSLKTNGQFKPIVGNIGSHTGRPNEILAGNHTLKAFRNLGERYPSDERWERIAVYWVDVDEDRATRIVLADNRTAEDSRYDDTLLWDMVKDLGGELEGTGFTLDDESRLADLSRLFSGPDDTQTGDDPGSPDSTVTVDLGKVPKQCAEAGLTVGVIRIKVPRDVYTSWYDDLREGVGFDSDSVNAEVLRRLGMGE